MIQYTLKDHKPEIASYNQVKDADRVQTLGKVTIPLSHVLKTSHLSLDQWFQLEDSGTASRIYINSVLRVNKSKVFLFFYC